MWPYLIIELVPKKPKQTKTVFLAFIWVRTDLPTQAASSFMVQPSLQASQSLLVEPVQVLQAA